MRSAVSVREGSRHLVVFIGCVLCQILPTRRGVEANRPGLEKNGQEVSALPQDVPGDWWSNVQKDIAQKEYQITWQERTCLPQIEGAWQAPNRAHDLRTYFTPQGPRVVRRRTEGEPLWVWGLELTGFSIFDFGFSIEESGTGLSPVSVGSTGFQPVTGHGQDARATLAVPPIEKAVTNGNRIEFHRGGGLVEWYVNSPAGLEQGFTVDEPPRRQDTKAPTHDLVSSCLGGEIVLELAVRGDLRPDMMPDDQTVEFLTAGGVGVIHYGQLRAHDATGRTLPARMELIENSDRMNRMDRIETEEKNAFDPVDPVNPVKEEGSSEILNPHSEQSKI